jgi:hypothetical protein
MNFYFCASIQVFVFNTLFMPNIHSKCLCVTYVQQAFSRFYLNLLSNLLTPLRSTAHCDPVACPPSNRLHAPRHPLVSSCKASPRLQTPRPTAHWNRVEFAIRFVTRTPYVCIHWRSESFDSLVLVSASFSCLELTLTICEQNRLTFIASRTLESFNYYSTHIS